MHKKGKRTLVLKELLYKWRRGRQKQKQLQRYEATGLCRNSSAEEWQEKKIDGKHLSRALKVK